MKQITVSELAEKLANNSNQSTLLDVRETWEYDICHIENSTHIPMGKIPTSLDQFKSDDEIIVICHHGIRSAQVTMYLNHMGFENVLNLKGGIENWATEIDNNMARY